MSAFYGQVCGCAETVATRRGSKNSGIRVSAQSYDGSVITSMDYNDKDELILTIDTAKDSRGSWGDTAFRGKFEDFTTMMKLANQVGTAEVIKTLTRKLSRK